MKQRHPATIKGVKFGNRDIGKPCVWFSTDVCGTPFTALQALEGDEMLRFVQDSGVYDLSELEGRACWVIMDRSFIYFDGLIYPQEVSL